MPTIMQPVDAAARCRDRSRWNWAVFLKLDLSKWPTIADYHQRHLERPSVVQAMGVEMAERQRRAA